MTDSTPSIEIQREFLKNEITLNKQQHWVHHIRAKNFKKAGLDDLAKSNSEAAAKIELYVDSLEEELRGIPDGQK